MARREWDHDVAVVGGGPAGSTAACALARRGHSVLLVDREVFPRFHIGESLLPWCSEIFQAIGAEDLIRRAGFVEKWGASFGSHDGRLDQRADFTCAVEVPAPQTWQVPRARFDQLLLEHAGACGATVLQGHAALDATFDADGVTLAFEDPEGKPRSARVGVVIDASGRRGFLARRFGAREIDPQLKNVAVHAQFEGVPRKEGRMAGDIRLITRPDLGWFWFIPISETVMSIGAVLPHAAHLARGRSSPVESLETYLRETPEAAALVKNARRTSDARFESDFSYLATVHAGDRWLLVGDAGAFLDPIFSTGVLLAMQSGLDAAAAISDGLAAGDVSARRFASFERAVRRRYAHFRRFAVGFYDPAFRALWFQPSSRWGTFEAVLSILAGNWRPSWMTRLRVAFFLALVRIQRHVPLVREEPRIPKSVA